MGVGGKGASPFALSSYWCRCVRQIRVVYLSWYIRHLKVQFIQDRWAGRGNTAGRHSLISCNARSCVTVHRRDS